MPATCPDVDADDLSRRERFERSRERSHARRLLALRRRRRQRGSRSIALVLAAALTIGSGGAFAATTGDGGSAGGVLKRGASGPLVAQVQQKLGITADGAFGPQTEKAVRRYQGSKGLEVDGVVGPQTARSLGVSLATAQAQSRGSGGGGGGNVRLPAILDSIAECESGGDPRAISPDGTYRGKYQFDRSTWASYGPAGDPARASEAEQDRRALKLYKARGTSPWPNCAG
jgi:peptidoglycan hydrolase-like protein with peptidoglycan-binding domain